jgi:hypothetical protein
VQAETKTVLKTGKRADRSRAGDDCRNWSAALLHSRQPQGLRGKAVVLLLEANQAGLNSRKLSCRRLVPLRRLGVVTGPCSFPSCTMLVLAATRVRRPGARLQRLHRWKQQVGPIGAALSRCEPINDGAGNISCVW